MVEVERRVDRGDDALLNHTEGVAIGECHDGNTEMLSDPV